MSKKATPVVPVKEFNEAIVELHQPMDELRELAAELSGTSPEGPIIFTEHLMRSLAGEGLAVIRHHARRGSLKAAMYLVDRCLGTPDQPFQDAVAHMSRDEAEAALFTAFKDQGFTDETAQKLVLASRQLPEPGALA